MIFRGRSKSNLSDDLLINNFKSSGDQKVLGELFLRYSHLVYGVCYKYLRNPEESKDAAMEVFDRLNTLLIDHEIQNFRSWIHSVAKNHCLMKLRRDNNKLFVPMPENETDDTSFMEFPDFLHLIDEKEEDDKINLLINEVEKLEEGQKLCIRLFFLENKSYNEINSLTGYDFKQVKSFLQNGKRNLRLRLEKFKETI